jgi:hypothetical protein
MSSILVRRRQRKAMRRSVRIDCEVVREKDFKLIGRRAVDLSDAGMLVLSEACGEPSVTGRRDACPDVLTGEEVIVSFRAPATRHWFDCPATVARVIHGRRLEDWGACLGLSFDLEEMDRVRLRAELRGLPPPLPAREARIDYAGTVHEVAFGN